MCLHFFFFIDTATTGIYTYVHTLSQHDALPIPRRRPPYRKPRLTEPPHRDGRPFTVGTDEDVCPTCNGSGRVLNAVPTEWRGSQISGLYRRSEEHTSELQSLMRISYAVFCLKKKKPKTRHY